MLCSPMKRASPVGRVRMSAVVVTIKGHRKSFQLYMKWKTKSVARAGRESGRMICQ